MDAQNENVIIIDNAIEVVAEPFNIINITEAQLLETDYGNNHSAEFLCDLTNIINTLTSYEDCPEALLMPYDDDSGNTPFNDVIEMLNDLKRYTWAKRTYNNMRRITAGIETERKLTQLQKSQHPDYKDWRCPKCKDYLKGNNELKKHQLRNICRLNTARLMVKPIVNKLPNPIIHHTVTDLEPLIQRSIQYKKNIENELEEDEYTP